jgi:hypothetical protein
METFWTEATKMDLLQWGVILFIIFGGGAGIIKNYVTQKLGLKPKKPGKYPEGHLNCDLYPEHVKALEKKESVTERITVIKYIDTVYEQMAKVGSYREKIYKILFDAYKARLPESGLSETQRKAALVSYKKDLKIALDDVQGYYRKCVKENHFTEKSDVEFNNYVIEKTESGAERLGDSFDVYYLQSVSIVDREELRATNRNECLPQIKELVSQMFFEIREIAEKKKSLIEEIQEEDI